WGRARGGRRCTALSRERTRPRDSPTECVHCWAPRDLFTRDRSGMKAHAVGGPVALVVQTQRKNLAKVINDWYALDGHRPIGHALPDRYKSGRFASGDVRLWMIADEHRFGRSHTAQFERMSEDCRVGLTGALAFRNQHNIERAIETQTAHGLLLPQDGSVRDDAQDLPGLPQRVESRQCVIGQPAVAVVTAPIIATQLSGDLRVELPVERDLLVNTALVVVAV